MTAERVIKGHTAPTWLAFALRIPSLEPSHHAMSKWRAHLDRLMGRETEAPADDQHYPPASQIPRLLAEVPDTIDQSSCPLSELLTCRICEHNYFILFFATTSWENFLHGYCNWDSWGERQEGFEWMFGVQGNISLLSNLLFWGRIPTNNWNWFENTWKLVPLFWKFLKPCFWTYSLEEFLICFTHIYWVPKLC